MEREELLDLFLQDAFDGSVQTEVIGLETFLERRQIEPYCHYGMTPPNRIDSKLHASFCSEYLLDLDFKESDFLAYLVYWTFRMKLRLIAQHEHMQEILDGDFTNDMLEELVEEQMLSHGVPRWWAVTEGS